VLKEPAWVQWLRARIGVAEFKGEPDNPQIVEMFRLAGCEGQAFTQDETPWCAGAVGAALQSVGIRGTHSAMARSYERWVGGMVLGAPVYGAVTVLDRAVPHPSQGHVGFLVGRSTESVAILGGNQNDAVSIATFPRKRVRGFYWPRGVLIEPEWVGPAMPAAAGANAPSDR